MLCIVHELKLLDIRKFFVDTIAVKHPSLNVFLKIHYPHPLKKKINFHFYFVTFELYSKVFKQDRIIDKNAVDKKNVYLPHQFRFLVFENAKLWSKLIPVLDVDSRQQYLRHQLIPNVP